MRSNNEKQRDIEKSVRREKKCIQKNRMKKSEDCSSDERKKIEEELKYVNQYLYIQKMRFQEHIICLVEIPEQLYEYYIPKLMIQPLLENAIVHGVSELKETGPSFFLPLAGSLPASNTNI